MQFTLFLCLLFECLAVTISFKSADSKWLTLSNHLRPGQFVHVKPQIYRRAELYAISDVNDAFQSIGDVVQSIPASESSGLSGLGKDFLAFLCATITIVPLFKWLKASSVIGFLSAGLLMGPSGLKLFSDLNDLEALADFGVLFLLFEQGLELTVERLQKLSKFAFGLGTLQIILSTIAFTVFPFLGGVQFLEFFINSSPELVDISRLDEAVVIGAALSLSSSAFVLKILQENGQLAGQFGGACLGVLLMQDIAVVPLLALLPIIESSSGTSSLQDQIAVLGETFIKAILGVGGILVIGGGVVRYLFSLVAQTKSPETFIALCLLVAIGTGRLTEVLGLSSTLGSFTAGTLLASSNYRTQVESDIKPFRGLLLGLFFMTTGATVDVSALKEEWPTVLALLAGLLSFKAVIMTGLAKLFGLSRGDSVRTGIILSGGGEFAFVVLNLADRLEVIPGKLAKILIGLVVISMALTPYLSKFGDKLASMLEDEDKQLLLKSSNMSNDESSDEDVVVVCGFGQVGENVMKVMKSIISKLDSQSKFRCMAFSLDPNLVVKGYRNGYDIMYGDGSQPSVLTTAGIDVARTKAFIVTYTDCETCLNAVEKLRLAYPNTPIISRSRELAFSKKLYDAGATTVITDEKEAILKLSQSLIRSLGLGESFDSAAVFDSIEGEGSIASRILAFNDEKVKETIDDADKFKRNFQPDDQDRDVIPPTLAGTGSIEERILNLEIEGSATCSLPTRKSMDQTIDNS